MYKCCKKIQAIMFYLSEDDVTDCADVSNIHDGEKTTPRAASPINVPSNFHSDLKQEICRRLKKYDLSSSVDTVNSIIGTSQLFSRLCDNEEAKDEVIGTARLETRKIWPEKKKSPHVNSKPPSNLAKSGNVPTKEKKRRYGVVFPVKFKTTPLNWNPSNKTKKLFGDTQHIDSIFTEDVFEQCSDGTGDDCIEIVEHDKSSKRRVLPYITTNYDDIQCRQIEIITESLKEQQRLRSHSSTDAPSVKLYDVDNSEPDLIFRDVTVGFGRTQKWKHKKSNSLPNSGIKSSSTIHTLPFLEETLEAKEFDEILEEKINAPAKEATDTR